MRSDERGGRTLLRRMFLFSWSLGFIVFSILASSAWAEGQKVTMANYELANKFSAENLKKLIFDLDVFPNWIGQSDTFWYRWTTSSGTDYYLVDCNRKKIGKVFENSVLAAALSGMFQKPFDPSHIDIDSLIFPEGTARAQFIVEGTLMEFDRAAGTLIKLSERKSGDEESPYSGALLKYIQDMTGGGTPRGSRLYSPGGRWGVFVRNHDLYVIDSQDPGKKEWPLSSDGEEWYGFDTSQDADNGHQNTDQIVFVGWFPDGNRFYATRVDRRKVRDMYLLQPLSQPYPTYKHYKNTLAGDENSDQYELWVFDCEKKTGTKIKTEKWTDQQLGGKAMDGGIYPLPDLNRIYFIRTDRTWTKTDLSYADLNTGEVRTVIEEELHPNVTPTSAQVRILNKGNDIIWWSDRDGWGHFYLYDGQGHLKNRITSGPFCCRFIVRADVASRTLHFTACGREPGHDPYYEHLYRVGFDGTGLMCLTPENANHASESIAGSFSFSPSGKYFVANHSRVDLAPQAVVRDASGNKVLELAPPDLSRLAAAGWKAPETFTVKAADDVTDLYGVMWKPFDLDPGKKYPIILHTYPGPISEAVPKTFVPLFPFSTDLSQLGFVVVMFGNRGGSAERSKAYNAFGYGNLRDFGLEDKKTGLERLAAQYPFIDIERVGVMGSSGGGFQSTTLMLTYPDFFKVCVSWAGNHDNSLMESYWPELCQGVKEIQEDGRTRFEVHTPTNMELAKNLKGHYLIMNGLQDSRVHPAIMYRMIQALIEANKPFDMYMIPDEQHQLSKARYLPYISRLIWQYFAFHLLGDPRSKAEVFAEYGSPVTATPWNYR